MKGEKEAQPATLDETNEGRARLDVDVAFKFKALRTAIGISQTQKGKPNGSITKAELLNKEDFNGKCRLSTVL